MSEKKALQTVKFSLLPGAEKAFADWQGKFHTKISNFDGFVSLEILAPAAISKLNWLINQRFKNQEKFIAWRDSPQYNRLMEELKPLLSNPSELSFEEGSDSKNVSGKVTEVFVTQVNPNKIKEFRDWIARIHQIEATFPGFQGLYIQAPTTATGQNWLTFLQFDSTENLDGWLNSPERKKILEETHPSISNFESHRVISPYGSWFAHLGNGVNKIPPIWKQTLLILLALFPIVMLEMMFLNPWTKDLNKSLGTFIGNAISVALISWPMYPICIYFLRWWASPKPENALRATILGTLLIILLYAIEVLIFWNAF